MIASIMYKVCDCIYQVLQPIYMSPPPVRKIGNKLNADLIRNGTFPTVLAHLMGNIS